VLFPAAFLSFHARAYDATNCGPLENAYGPFDYTNPDDVAKHLPIVESHHFDAQVERLRPHARYGGHWGGDISYTLRAFPNHHRALQAMARWELQSGKSPPPKSPYTADCWFQRAILFKPDDATVRMIYGTFLQRKGNLAAALREYQEAQRLGAHNPQLEYNLGLLFFEQGQYEIANSHAIKAYSAGISYPGLRKKLKSVGHWEDQ
jgi:tetratricopeptide (TPR) repeat protein